MKLKIFLLLLVSIISFNACDILRFSKFEVVSWSPGGGFHSQPEKIGVTLNFSRDPDRASVEKNFSLTGDGNRVKGNILWDGKKLIFSPLSPLEKNTDYTISLSADAYDSRGLNLDDAFNGFFTTRPDNVRPVLLSFFPAMYAQVDDLLAEVRLEFSMPIPLKILYDNVSFSPSMTGNWRLENEGKLAVFTPSQPWVHDSRYEIRFSTSLTDNNGMNIGNDFTSVFTMGTDKEAPYLLNVRRITKNGLFFDLVSDKGFSGVTENPVENQDWEKEDRFLLIFSKPVDSISVKNYISVENGPNLVMETSAGFNTEFVFRFESVPVYESRFTLKIRPGIKDRAGNESKNEYIYKIFANGKLSKPPVLMGMRIPIAPENDIDPDLEHFGKDSLFEHFRITDKNYPSAEKIETWIELYFETAAGAEIDIFSLMELFRVDTSNNVITFSPRHVKTNNFSVPDPQSGWEIFQRIEITGILVNSIHYGIINFQIAAGLRDSFGNRNEKLQRISLIK